MTAVAGHELDWLRSRLSGRVITAVNDYDQAHPAWSGAIDRRPAVIARCAGPGDVAAAVGFARQAGWRSRCAAARTTSAAPRPATAA